MLYYVSNSPQVSFNQLLHLKLHHTFEPLLWIPTLLSTIEAESRLDARLPHSGASSIRPALVFFNMALTFPYGLPASINSAINAANANWKSPSRCTAPAGRPPSGLLASGRSEHHHYRPTSSAAGDAIGLAIGVPALGFRKERVSDFLVTRAAHSSTGFSHWKKESFSEGIGRNGQQLNDFRLACK